MASLNPSMGRILASAIALGVLAATAHAQSDAEAPLDPGEALIAAASAPWTGDLDGMLERRTIRVLVVPTRTQYWVERARTSGVTYEAISAFEAALNRKYKQQHKHLRVDVLFVPTARDELIPKLLDGRGDIAAAALTITPERLQQVDFGAPLMRGVREIAVTGSKSPAIATLEDLAGQVVFVRRSSSYWTHLEALSEQLEKSGKPAIELSAAPEDLQDDEILEMVHAGLVGITVVDEYAATLWAKVLKDIRPHPDIVVNTEGELAWMIRKQSPLLKAEIEAFASSSTTQKLGKSVLKKYLGSTRFVKPATSKDELKKFERTVALFRTYSGKYDLDHLLMMAQGYQESRLNQEARSAVGAIGVMQVMPGTGKDMRTGDITKLDANIHAGVKYVRFLQNQFFEKEPMDPLNKTLFTFAAYNCGPGCVQKLRKRATKLGLDPNVWRNNVELVAARQIGAETVSYVANIYKYYVAYRLIEGVEASPARGG